MLSRAGVCVAMWLRVQGCGAVLLLLRMRAGCVCHVVVVESTEALHRVVTMAHVPVGAWVSGRCLGMYGVHVLFKYESNFTRVHQAHDKLHGLDEKLLVEWEMQE